MHLRVTPVLSAATPDAVAVSSATQSTHRMLAPSSVYPTLWVRHAPHKSIRVIGVVVVVVAVSHTGATVYFHVVALQHTHILSISAANMFGYKRCDYACSDALGKRCARVHMLTQVVAQTNAFVSYFIRVAVEQTES